MGLVPGEDCAQMPFAEDQHPIGDLGPGGEHEPFRIAVRSRAPRRDFHDRDTSPGQDRVERCGELTGAVPDQEPEAGRAIVEVHQQVTDLLGGPWPVRVRGDAESVCRFGAGGIFRVLRTRRMVEALTRWPSLSSSPRIRW
jgi:hypothetical protein